MSVLAEAPTQTYSYAGKTYAIYEITGLSWEEANDYCNELGGHLATITTSEEQGFITQNILSNCSNNLYWIGGKRVNGNWTWITGENFEYTNWAYGEPTTTENEDYIHIYGVGNNGYSYRGEWNNTFLYNDRPSSAFYSSLNCGFICEWDNFGNDQTEFEALVGTKWKTIQLDGELNSTNGIDSDYDTLIDWQEINPEFLVWNEDGSFELPTLRDCIYRINSESQIVSVLNAISSRTLTPITTYATSSSSATIGPSPLDLSVLIIKSDPTSEDTDKDGYCDVDDPNALSTPTFLNGEYDFLDGEIYSIFDYSNGKNKVCFDVKGASTTTGTQVIMYDFNGNDNQKFRFKWHGNGYTIHPLNNENMSLTVNKSSYEVRLSPNSINPSSTELWEVIPYYLGTEAVFIRSKYVETSSTGKNTALYLSYENDILKLSNDRSSNTKLFLENPLYDWKRFGELYIEGNLEDISYEKLGSGGRYTNLINAFFNYRNNFKIGFDGSEIRSSGTGYYNVLYAQEKGNFPKMKFGISKMSKVGCVIMATYNALSLAGEYDYIQNGVITNDLNNFYKLAVEFEMNAMNIFNALGVFGNDSSRIEDCLNVYNREYKIYNEKENKIMDFDLEHGAKSAIVTYNHFGILNLQAHAYCCYYNPLIAQNNNDMNDVISFNLWSETPPIFARDESISNSISKINNDGENRKFQIGYILL